MKRLLKILLIICLIGCSRNQRTRVIEKYPDGSTKSVKEFIGDENENYIIKYFYENGKLEFEGKVANEKFVGYKKAFFENGNPKEIVELADSARLNYCCPNGFYRYYFKDGSLKETHYKKEGKLNGLIVAYDSLGNKIIEYLVENDLKDGITKTYHENGSIYSVKTYKHDTLVGNVYYFDKNGDSLKIYATFQGKEDFPAKKWLRNGQIFYATYTDTTFDRVQYLWTDTIGNENKKINLERGQVNEFLSESGWVTPN